MATSNLPDLYRDYIACLNRQDWGALGRFVAEGVRHNGRPLGLSGYRAMLEQDFRDIPDLSFKIALLACEGTYVAARLQFDCTPTATFLGLAVNGKRLSFAENVFYEFRAGRIVEVWSVIDKAAVEEQLA